MFSNIFKNNFRDTYFPHKSRSTHKPQGYFLKNVFFTDKLRLNFRTIFIVNLSFIIKITFNKNFYDNKTNGRDKNFI